MGGLSGEFCGGQSVMFYRSRRPSLLGRKERGCLWDGISSVALEPVGWGEYTLLQN